jgi:PAS domain S-box-containing protein
MGGQNFPDKWIGKPESELIAEIERLSLCVEAAERAIENAPAEKSSEDANHATDANQRRQADIVGPGDGALLQSIIDNSPVTISLKDLDQRFILVNKAFKEVYGRTIESLVGTVAGPQITSQDREKMLAMERSVIETGEPKTQERTQTLLSGKQYFQLTTKFPVRDSSGAITGVGTISSDIGDIKNAQQELEDVQGRLSDILKLAPEAIISIDENEKIVVFNDAAERTFGYDADEILGCRLEKLLPHRFRANHHNFLAGFVQSDSKSRRMTERGEVSGLRKDGSEFPAEASISKLSSQGQTILTVSMHDITERKDAELLLQEALSDARQADKSKESFLANMSHELRTPLNAIMGFSEIMETELFGGIENERYRGYIGDISTSARHLLELVNDVLDLSKLEAGQQELHVTEFNIAAGMEDAVRVVRGLMDAKDQRYAPVFDDSLLTMEADETAFRQILVNLLSNAIKFTPKGGDIRLECSLEEHEDPADDLVLITVSDTGVGIPQEDLERIVTPFAQVRHIAHTGPGGTGLGLSIVNSLVHLHEGTLRIESELGVGTQVYVRLPRISRFEKSSQMEIWQ